MGKPNRECESAGSATMDEFIPTFIALKKEGMTVGDLAWMRSNDCGTGFNSLNLVDFIREQRAMSEPNPFYRSPEEIISRLESASTSEGWEISRDVIRKLRDTVPKLEYHSFDEELTNEVTFGDVFLSLRVRFGEGRNGVRETFRRHLQFLAHFLGDDWTEPDSLPVVNLLNGNQSHKPIVEWVLIDASAGNSLRRRNVCLPDSYGGPNSIADEGLVLAWLYPGRFLNKPPFKAMMLEGYRHNRDNTCSLATNEHDTDERVMWLGDKHSYCYVHTRPVILNV